VIRRYRNGRAEPANNLAGLGSIALIAMAEAIAYLKNTFSTSS
jgi:hypothetical protein